LEPTPLITTDAVVIGAGPVGLFQVFELGLLGLQAHVVDSLPAPGGQCIELYPDKPIYDIPGTPVCSGRELVARLLQQMAPFKAGMHLGQQVNQVQLQNDGGFHVETSAGTRFSTRTVFIAAGVGSFQPRRLPLEGLSAFEGTQVFYQNPPALVTLGQHVVVVGQGEAALACAVHLAPTAHVTLMHRREEFKATPATVAQVQQLRQQNQLQFVAGQATGFMQTQGQLTALQVSLSDGATRELPATVLVVLSGLSPKLGPVADWGLALERKQLVVNTETFETSTPGIFAVGDVNTYPGKKKLILCGFHEAALAAFGAAARINPEEPVTLQYTTTSTRLHQRLGVVVES
jgi:thioredoxin reductase (NADPH)